MTNVKNQIPSINGSYGISDSHRICVVASWCLKITEKSHWQSFVYILRSTKFIKNAKNGQLDDFLKIKVCGQTVLPDRAILLGQKLVENANKCDILGKFKQYGLDSTYYACKIGHINIVTVSIFASILKYRKT